MVIDIFTLSVKCHLIICYDQIHDVFNLISNHYAPTYHDNIGSYFYFSLFTTESIALQFSKAQLLRDRLFWLTRAGCLSALILWYMMRRVKKLKRARNFRQFRMSWMAIKMLQAIDTHTLSTRSYVDGLTFLSKYVTQHDDECQSTLLHTYV